MHNKIKGEIVGLIQLVHAYAESGGLAKSAGSGKVRIQIQQEPVRSERAHDVAEQRQLR